MTDSLLNKRRIIILASLLIIACIGVGGLKSKNPIIENKQLSLEISERTPLIYSFYYKPGNIYFKGDIRATGWIINGKLFRWSKWKIQFHKTETAASYRMSLPELKIRFDYTLSLTGEGVHISLDQIQDPNQCLKTVSWGNAPLLSCDDTSFHWWARKTYLSTPWKKNKIANRGLWSDQEENGKAGDTISRFETMDACLWNKDKVVIGLVDNTDLFPVQFNGNHTDGVTFALPVYRHKLQSHIMKNMQADFLFLPDLNGDHVKDDRDYFLWKNRHLEDQSAFLRSALSYKIFMDVPPLKTPATTLIELKNMVKSVYNITDGIPQIVYMVGWQYHGHDTGYPSLDKWNERLGPHKMVYSLAKYFSDSLRTCLSYHINIDDAYKNSKNFSDDIMATDYDGGPMYWQMGITDTCYHISHYKDVKTGSIFKRINKFFQTVPVKKVIHIDAMRTINCNPAWEQDSIGVADELELGLKPILQYLKDKGIVVTTEGQNGMPHELTGLISGFWHLQGASTANLMIYHKKIIGGGRGEGTGRVECGLGTSIHADISYTGKNNTVSFIKDWKLIKERIYLGSLLYRYYLERNLINVISGRDSIFFQFDDGTVTHINLKTNTLSIKRKDVTIAFNDDRFIPFDNCIYAFSKTGSDREWTLPPLFRGKSLNVFTLTDKGRGIAPAYKIAGNEIQLKLLANVPVKIEVQ